jgi:putative ABC transport system permease protein
MWKLPTAWLQLKYQKTRLLVALVGVTFSVVITFMQFGIRDALFDSAVLLHQGLQGDCFLISPRSTAYIAMESFSERRLTQALAFEEVELVSPIYLGFGQWKNPQTRKSWRNIFIIGVDLRHRVLNLPGVEKNQDKLKMPDTVLFDQSSRSEFGPIVKDFEKQGSVTTEIIAAGSNHKITVVGLFQLGTSFGADGNLLTSNLNFLRIFNRHHKGFIHIGLIQLKPGQDVEKFVKKLREFLPKDVKVLSKQGLIEFEKSYWQSGAIGIIFTFGVLLGSLVGVVVVYQILYTNVSEHLAEYATLKAMGYHHRYLLSMVLQQSLLIVILGYIPGLLLSILLSDVVKQATLLPIAMNFHRAISVFLLTTFICCIAGATAVRKLKAADPADIF